MNVSYTSSFVCFFAETFATFKSNTEIIVDGANHICVYCSV